MLHLLGIHQVAVIVNKMDRLDFDEGRFPEIEGEIANDLSRFRFVRHGDFSDLCARWRRRDGQNHSGLGLAYGPTVIEVLDRVFAGAIPARFAAAIPVQGVYKFDDKRIIAGRVESGRIAIGDELVIMPRGTTARVRSIETWPVPNGSQVARTAQAGRSIGLTLDGAVFVERGDLISTVDVPSTPVRWLRARVFWLHDEPLTAGAVINVRVGMAERRGTITSDRKCGRSRTAFAK